uniref:Secreted peptide n=1 Tax=Oryza brachyantha TaxID=4533 RepID=J3MT62_ORYBR
MLRFGFLTVLLRSVLILWSGVDSEWSVGTWLFCRLAACLVYYSRVVHCSTTVVLLLLSMFELQISLSLFH